jgi:acetoin utilization deacetylase AcuC-like enzyme
MMLPIAFAPSYAHPLPDGHRFPMLKYELLPEQLLREGTATAADFFVAAPPPVADVLLVHDADYYERLRLGQLTRQEERATGFPWSQALFEREITILGGTIEAARLALQHGVAFNIAGGTHHAFRARGEGFCLLNDQAAAAAWLLAHAPGVAKVLIVDLDVHQGNGTAAIFQHEPRVFTFSMHGARNYPARKEASDLDLPLPDGTDDATYLKLLAETLPRLLDDVQPDFVFYLAGVDVLATDKLGHLALTREGCRQRDELVLGLCQRHRLPVVVCMGGGYSERIADIVEAHANTFRTAAKLFS